MFSQGRIRAHIAVIASALVFSLVASVWLFVVRIEPSALLVRTYEEKFAAAVAVETDHFAPSIAIKRKLNQNYGDGGADTAFDIYRPASALTGALPTIIWIHGGGWIAGSKADVAPYLRKIASARFTVVALNYPLAPAHTYPTATRALNDGLAYLLARADVYGIDPNNIILAGNDAGANLASQLAAASTNPKYAAQLGLDPALEAAQLKGVVLAGGLYDVAAAAAMPGLSGWSTGVELRAYTGSQTPLNSPDVETISTINAVSAAFPPTWIAAADGDPLTSSQAVPFADALTRAGVPVSALFPTTGGSLPSDFQFLLTLDESKRAFASLINFAEDVTR